jgi:uncharacterized protein YcbK (DUF882 family)
MFEMIPANDQQENKQMNRRSFIGAGLAAGAMLPLMAKPVLASPFAPPRAQSYALSFQNIHTGEKFSGEYRVGNRYLPDAFEEINHVLRDFRTNEIFPIDPRVMDIIYQVHLKTGSKAPYEVLSGYRCPKTNAMLRKASTGVAKHSLHMVGQAIDVRLPGFSTAKLRDAARGLRAGGVGYYPASNFVHMDSGRVRHW